MNGNAHALTERAPLVIRPTYSGKRRKSKRSVFCFSLISSRVCSFTLFSMLAAYFSIISITASVMHSLSGAQLTHRQPVQKNTTNDGDSNSAIYFSIIKHSSCSRVPVSWAQLTAGLSLTQSTTAHARPTYNVK